MASRRTEPTRRPSFFAISAALIFFFASVERRQCSSGVQSIEDTILDRLGFLSLRGHRYLPSNNGLGGFGPAPICS